MSKYAARALMTAPFAGITRRLAAGVLTFAAGLAAAQSYPSGPMRIVSPYPPGGGTDLLARAIGPRLTERHGFPVIVENRPGANGTVGTGVAARAPPDGHTMVIVAAGYAAGSSLYKSLPYDPSRDLAPVSLLASGPLVLVVHPSLPAKSVRELVALAKSRPGEINVGNSGVGSLPHLTAALFGSMSGVKLTHVPYKGPGAALVDLLSGQVPVYFMNVYGALPLAKANKLRALAISSTERSTIAPALPTMVETGLAGFDMTNWYGLLVPAATPRDSLRKLRDEVARIMTLPEFRELLTAGGMTAVASTPEQFSAFVKAESAKYARVIELAGVRPE